ncbi:UDP-N-acetylglucosamine 2-epimerase (non-hydrolyzing) [Ramlibacter sp. 2FC]|uniref:non-hydrolyzing UDP-N-acetylglucosamine 2-epimerase n=1 Tax=Ramlibacter sp. 2FC TaxID=2502188 RepID=UPI0032E49BA0
MIVLGTRPEVIKLAPVVAEARRRADRIELLVCSTGQHREMLDQALKVFGIQPDVDLAVMRESQSLPGLTARLLESLSATMTEHRPDAVLVQGDTTSALVGALAAFYQRIPVGHVEAGLRTGDLASPFPEELNRTLIGRMAGWHFAPTARAAENLVRENIDSTQVMVTGNTVVDAIAMMQSRWHNGSMPSMPRPFPDKPLVLITAHRRENHGSVLVRICAALRSLCERHPELGFVFPVHLNPKVRTEVFTQLDNIANLRLIDPVDFETNLYLQSQSRLIITDSGGIQEEAPSFGVPTVVMREHTERSEGIVAGFASLAGTGTDAVIHAAEAYLADTQIQNRLSRLPNPYGDGLASQRILSAMLGESVQAFAA